MTEKLLANTNKQELSKHSIAVANVSVQIFKSLGIEESTVLREGFDNVKKLEESIFLAGLFHDWGKADKNFQSYLRTDNKKQEPSDGVHMESKKEGDKFSFSKYPRHNEISWALVSNLLPGSKCKNFISFIVYYHHAKIKRVENGKEINWNARDILNKVFSENGDLNDFSIFTKEVLDVNKGLPENIKEIIFHIQEKLENIDFESIERIATPDFLYEGVIDEVEYLKSQKEKDKEELRKLLVRSIVVSADRIVSNISVKELDYFVEENNWSWVEKILTLKEDYLSVSIGDMLDNFKIKNEFSVENKKRDLEQAQVAKKLSESDNPAVLFGPAGCGKTKIFLEWFKNKAILEDSGNGKKLMIIAPRKIVCASLFEELKNTYIPKSNIEVITGDGHIYWDGENQELIELEQDTKKEAEVTIITIDQLVATMLSHRKIDLLVEYLKSYVVFDEFHEFFNIPGIIILFKLFVRMKSLIKNSKLLLVSATPNPYFVEKVLDIDSSKNTTYIDTFNKEMFNFDFSIYENSENDLSDINDSILFKNQPKGSIVVFNTAKNSQLSSLRVEKENTINFHSKFTLEDKKEIMQKVVKEFSKKDPCSDSVLRSGPIVQASLNISTLNLITQITSAENLCQRVGRANRFASENKKAKITIVLSENTLKGVIGKKNPELNFLNKIAMSNQTISFLDFIKETWFSGGELTNCDKTLSQLYQLYSDFHRTDDAKRSYQEDFEKVLVESFKIFRNNDFTPYEYKKAVKKKNDKLSSTSIRGASVYVLPVLYDVFDENKRFKDWLYIPSEEIETNKLISISELDLNRYQVLINNQKELLKNQKINGFTEATYNKNYKNMSDLAVKSEAKFKSSPLIVSYVDQIKNSEEYNVSGLVYLTKGFLKLGLIELSLI